MTISQELKATISNAYSEKIRSSESCCNDGDACGTGYPVELVQSIPEGIASFGCGSPTAESCSAARFRQLYREAQVSQLHSVVFPPCFRNNSTADRTERSRGGGYPGTGRMPQMPWESRSVVVPRVSSLGHRAPVVHPGTLEVLRHDNGIAVRRNEGRQPGFNQAHPIRRSCPAPVLREHSPSPAWRKPSGSEAVAGDIAHRWSRQSGRENFH